MPRVEHRFTGPSYTLGIEEELMIVDAETLELVNGIETMLESVPEGEGEVKPELMESVLEIATTPCKTAGEAGGQLRELRRLTAGTARTTAWRSARPAPIHSPCGRTSASWPGRATATSWRRCGSWPGRS